MILLLLQALLPLALAACPEHPAPQHGDLAPSPWQEGAIVIRCHYGLVPLGAGVAFCEGEAWSEELECGEALALLLGGDEEDGYSYRAELFPPTGCREVPHLPQPVHGGAAAWVGGMVVVCGGEPQPFAMTTECFGYSVEDNLWLELPGLSSPRSMLSGVAMDGALVVTGGYDKDYYGTDIRSTTRPPTRGGPRPRCPTRPSGRAWPWWTGGPPSWEATRRMPSPGTRTGCWSTTRRPTPGPSSPPSSRPGGTPSSPSPSPGHCSAPSNQGRMFGKCFENKIL